VGGVLHQVALHQALVDQLPVQAGQAPGGEQALGGIFGGGVLAALGVDGGVDLFSRVSSMP
jgi:hypothetical protein